MVPRCHSVEIAALGRSDCSSERFNPGRFNGNLSSPLLLPGAGTVKAAFCRRRWKEDGDERPAPKSALYVSVLKMLMLRGRVEQLASAVPQKPTGGSGEQRQLLPAPN